MDHLSIDYKYGVKPGFSWLLNWFSIILGFNN